MDETFFDPSVVDTRYLSSVQRSPTGNIVHGLVSPSTGYIRIRTFGDGGRDWATELDVALSSLKSVAALIIDVRNNEGGSTERSSDLAGRFATRMRTFARVRYRNGPKHGDLSSLINRVVKSSGGQPFVKPVYLLTNRRSASASEEFVLALSVAAAATTVGDTTAGAMGSPLTRELSNGWTYQVPQWIEYTLDGRIIEGVGLLPEHWVENTRADLLRGVDLQLERAIALARERSVSKPDGCKANCR